MSLSSCSIKQRINDLNTLVTLAVSGAAIFIYFIFGSIANEYQHINETSTASVIEVLEIQKDLNYISRMFRDTMLGGNYQKDIKKLQKHTHKIVQNNANKNLDFLSDGKNTDYIEYDPEIINNFTAIEEASSELFCIA